jgi:Uma2 family endonuclease
VRKTSPTFQLPNGATRNPDAAWIPLEKWNRIPQRARRRFAPICPDLVIELRSETDRLHSLQAKMEEYLANGAQLGFLIDPFEGTVHIYRPRRQPEILNHPSILSAEPEMSGLVFDLGDVW